MEQKLLHFLLNHSGTLTCTYGIEQTLKISRVIFIIINNLIGRQSKLIDYLFIFFW